MRSSLAKVAPIVAQDMPTVIAERIKRMIAEGNFAPGEQLTETELANAFGVSRGPIREAIQRLTQEGLLVSEHNRGTFVPVLSRSDVEDVYVIRGALEIAAMEQLIVREPAGALEELDHILDDLQAAVDAAKYDKADRLDHEFHRRIMYLSGSTRLAHAFERISVETLMCLRLLKFSHPAHPDIVEWHRSFVNAVRARDVDAVREAVSFHNRTVLQDLFVEDDPELSEEPA